MQRDGGVARQMQTLSHSQTPGTALGAHTTTVLNLQRRLRHGATEAASPASYRVQKTSRLTGALPTTQKHPASQAGTFILEGG
eukprot:2659768-Pleurochrysis_carterae.AAC.2